MVKPFDRQMKRLAQTSPQTLLQWFLPGAEYIKELPLNLELTKFDVDVLLKIKWHEHEMLLHIEFQTFNDLSMAERALRYNVLARIEHKLPVLSVVIYLFQGGTLPASPLCWDTPSGHTILDFHFLDVKLWEMTTETLEKLDNHGLLALISLTQDGARRHPVKRMLTTLYEKPEDADLLVIGYNLAMLAFKKRSRADLEWLRKEFAYMQERFEESPFYQMILERGHEEGREEGWNEGAHSMLLAVIRAKYARSDLAELAEKIVRSVNDRAVLHRLVGEVAQSSTPEDARALLLANIEGPNLQH